MKPIILPNDCNYIGCFLTMKCNLGCSYCINHHITQAQMAEEMSPEAWIDGLSRIETRSDLPITIQGGEPTVYPGFHQVADSLFKLNKHADLLTNGLFDLREFCHKVHPDTFKRNAKYASIRFSYHEKTNHALIFKVWEMQNAGYEVGIWGVKHPSPIVREQNDYVKEACRWLNIDYREKEFLGIYNGEVHGTYKYRGAVGKKKGRKVWCKSKDFLINPSGHIFRCHADLYANSNFIGHILDNEIKFPGFTECNNYGRCNPCDIKLKYNRFQEGGHCSVEIKGKGIRKDTIYKEGGE